MAQQFVLESVLRARDDLSKVAVSAFGRVQDAGDRVAKRIGKRLMSELSGKKLAKNLGKLKNVAAGAALTGAAGLGAAAYGFERVADSMSRTARFAEELDLDAVFLAALKSEGARHGIENIEDMDRAVEEFALRIAELRSNTGAMHGFLKGIKADGLITQFKDARTNTDALKVAFAALAKETNAQNRVALSDAFFGGNDASLDMRRIVKSEEELAQFLATIEDLSGATKEEFENVQRLAAARAKLNQRIGTTARSITGKLAPAVERIVNNVESWAWANEELIETKLERMVEYVTKQLDKMVSMNVSAWLDKVVAGASEAATTLSKLASETLGVARTLIAWGGKVASTARSLGLQGQTLVTLASAFFAAWAVGKIVAMGGALVKLGQLAVTAAGHLRTVTRTAGGAGRALATALSFAGPITAAMTLASVLGDVISKLTGIEDFAERHVEHDIAGQAEAEKEEIEKLRKKRRQRELELGFQSAVDSDRKIQEIDEEIATRRTRRETIEAVGKVKSGEVAGFEGARREFAELLSGDIDIDQASALRDIVLSRGGSVSELRQFVQDEMKRMVDEAGAEIAETKTRDVVNERLATRNAGPAPKSAETGASMQEFGGYFRDISMSMRSMVREFQETGKAVRDDLNAMERLVSEQKTQALLGRR